MASTVSRFNTLRHGSPLKFELDIATEHLSRPTQSCIKKEIWVNQKIPLSSARSCHVTLRYLNELFLIYI